MGKRVSQNRAVCESNAFSLLPHHPMLCQIFALTPIFTQTECKKSF